MSPSSKNNVKALRQLFEKAKKKNEIVELDGEDD
jgi:hypothetical protein